MTGPNAELLHAVMQACVTHAPHPLYPKEIAEGLGVERGLVDAALDHLRLAGALELTEWVAGKGQGYRPTEQGLDAMRSPVAVPLPARAPRPTTSGSLTEYERGERVRAVFLDPKPAPLTKILIALNVAIFLIGMALCGARGIPTAAYLTRSTNDLRIIQEINRLSHDMGSLSADSYIVGHEWWRLVSYQFLHGGIVHLLFNMVALYSLGPLVENMWGWKKMLLIYLYSGIAGGCFALLFSSGNLVGASAAIYGILTSIGAWVYLNRGHLGTELPPLIFRNVRNMLVLMVLISLAPGISLAGHAGGAIGGVLIAFPLHALASVRDLLRPAVWLLPLVLAAPVGAVEWRLGRDESVRMARAEWILLDVYNEVLLPAIRGRKQFEDSDVTRRAQDLLPRARTAIEEYSQRLSSMAKESDGETRKEIDGRIEYFNDWTAILNALEAAAKASPEQRDAGWDDIADNLIELRDKMLRARNIVLTNKILAPPGEWTPIRNK